MAAGDIRIGISGWTYAGWRGVFYPKGLRARDELRHASRALNAIEINGTFYSLQRASSFERWYDETPRGFRFALKGSRFITHMKQLNDVRIPLANFFASGPLALEEKLGPILWQFSERMRFDAGRFEAFMQMLPRTTADAVRLGRRHDGRLKESAWLHPRADRTIRHAFEVRHESFRDDRFIELLRTHGMALVASDAAADWLYGEDVTSDFIYARLHGAEELYASGYTEAALDRWAARVRTWASGREPADAERLGSSRAPVRARRDVYVFFDNDRKVKAPFDARMLAARLDLDWSERHEDKR